MPKATLTWESEFLVKEEKKLVGFIGFFFLGIFVYGLIPILKNGITRVENSSYFYLLFLLPAFFFFRKLKSNRIFIRVNKKGIYQDEQFVTGWNNFLNAYINQKEARYISIQDNFQLVIEYMKQGADKGFRRSIPLTNTQNQSEEDVLAAIRFFWRQYQERQA